MGRRAERGSATLELVILAPVLLIFISVMIYGGRVALAGQAVQQAADEAARVASIARTQGDADQTAGKAARDTLDQQGLECVTTTVNVDTRGFGSDIGETSSVTATITCDVRVGDLAIPGLPGTKRVTASTTSPIDTWRQR